MDICSFPQLIAACHVLLRLLVPRHPPYALSCLTSVRPPDLAFDQVLIITIVINSVIAFSGFSVLTLKLLPAFITECLVFIFDA